MDWGSLAVNGLVSAIAGSGILGLYLARAQRKQIQSQTGVNDAEIALKKAQLEVSLSTEARQLLEVYSNDSKAARKEAETAREKAAEAIAKTRLAEGRLDYLIGHLRANGYSIPDFPFYLTKEALDDRGY